MQTSLTARFAFAAAAFCTTLLMLAANAELADRADGVEAANAAATSQSTGSAA